MTTFLIGDPEHQNATCKKINHSLCIKILGKWEDSKGKEGIPGK